MSNAAAHVKASAKESGTERKLLMKGSYQKAARKGGQRQQKQSDSSNVRLQRQNQIFDTRLISFMRRSKEQRRGGRSQSQLGQ